MSTPHDPGQNPGGDPPQDPQNPQNPQDPYGAPPAQPGPPPQDPAAAPPYGQPAPPAYGQPAQPAYGQPAQPAYGQPAQPAYGQPGQPGYQQPFPQYGAPNNDAPKGMAIGALVASFFGCVCVGALIAIPLAIIVLRRGKDGRNHGKGLAIAALIISVISLLIGAGIGALIGYATTLTAVEDLKAGQCINADGLSDEDADGISAITVVGCSDGHDGEVLATSTLSADQATGLNSGSAFDTCAGPVEAAGSGDVLNNADLLIVALTEQTKPDAGDKLVCVITNADGSDLKGKLGS